MKEKNKDISNKIVPLHDRIVIREIVDTKEKKTSSGIILSSGTKEDTRGKRGLVVAVGPGRMDDGKIVIMSIKIGDTVLFQWGDQVNIDGEDYYVVRESEILAVINF